MKYTKYLAISAIAALLLVVAYHSPLRTIALSGNLIANSSFEKMDAEGMPYDWEADHWGALDAAFLTGVPGIDGGVAVEVVVRNHRSGDAKWSPDLVPVDGNRHYVYTSNYIADTTTELSVRYLDSDGDEHYHWLTFYPPAASWRKVSETFLMPTDAVEASVLQVLADNGTLSIDDVTFKTATEIEPPREPGVPLPPGPTPGFPPDSFLSR